MGGSREISNPWFDFTKANATEYSRGELVVLNLAWNVNWFFDSTRANLICLETFTWIYMCNKYLMRNPVKMNGWYNSQHLFFQCPAGKKNMGFFFLNDHIFSGIIDVRHFVGFLFRRYGKKTIQQAIYFPKICVRILKGYVQSLSLDISSAEQFLH